MSAPRLFNRTLLRQRLARAQTRQDRPLFLLDRAATEMAERLSGVQREFNRVLTIGVGAQPLADALASSCSSAELIVAMEPLPPVRTTSKVMSLSGDEESLPFGDGAFDLIASGLSLHLVNDLPGALVQIRRALQADGLFLGAVLGGSTLAELREAFMEAEMELEGGVSPRVAPMADIRDFGGLLQRAGFSLPVTDTDPVTVTYDSPLALMHDVRAMGASNPLTERRKTLLRRQTLMRAVEIYFERFAEPGGRVRASFEIIHLAGWAPHESQQQPLKPGSATARLSDALGVKEQRFKRS